AFSTICPIFTEKTACQQGNPISIKQGIELVEGESSRALGTDKKQFALSKIGLNGRDVERFQQLRLEQFTNPDNLMARQRRVGIGQESVGGKVGWIGVDRLPSFYQSKLLEAQITVDLGKGCAARRQV